MPLDRRIELRIFDAIIANVPRGITGYRCNRVGGSAERVNRANPRAVGQPQRDSCLWIIESGGGSDVESIIPGLLIVRDDQNNEYEVNGVSTDDQSTKFSNGSVF